MSDTFANVTWVDARSTLWTPVCRIISQRENRQIRRALPTKWRIPRKCLVGPDDRPEPLGMWVLREYVKAADIDGRFKDSTRTRNGLTTPQRAARTGAESLAGVTAPGTTTGRQRAPQPPHDAPPDSCACP